jgi:hypothetical protein
MKCRLIDRLEPSHPLGRTPNVSRETFGQQAIEIKHKTGVRKQKRMKLCALGAGRA